MNRSKHIVIWVAGLSLAFGACSNPGNPEGEQAEESGSAAVGSYAPGQSAVKDDESQPNIVRVAMGSKDHTTLVEAIKAAELVDVMSNNGPFTVFAPTNDAFAALPAGVLDDLLKPENKNKLQDILYHHVQVAVLTEEWLTDGKDLVMFDGTSEMISNKDGKMQIGGANVLGSVPASNGIVYVIDKVLVPPAAN